MTEITTQQENAKTPDKVIGQSKEGTVNTDCIVWGSQSNDPENGEGSSEKANGASFSNVEVPMKNRGNSDIGQITIEMLFKYLIKR